MYRLWGSEHETSGPAFWLLNGNRDFSIVPPYLTVHAESLSWQNLFHITYTMCKLVEKCYFWNYSLVVSALAVFCHYLGKGRKTEGRGAQAISLCIISSLTTWRSIWTTGNMVVTVKYWVCDILFSVAMSTGWFCCYMHAVFLWFTFQAGIGGECLSSKSGSLQSISL